MKERRRVTKRIREQQRDRSDRKRPSAAEASTRRAEQRKAELIQRELDAARRLPLPRVDNGTFDRLAALTSSCLQAFDDRDLDLLKRNQPLLLKEWQAVLPGHEFPILTLSSSFVLPGHEYGSEGANEKAVELEKELTDWEPGDPSAPCEASVWFRDSERIQVTAATERTRTESTPDAILDTVSPWESAVQAAVALGCWAAMSLLALYV
jgi:hypothetical protein